MKKKKKEHPVQESLEEMNSSICSPVASNICYWTLLEEKYYIEHFYQNDTVSGISFVLKHMLTLLVKN